mmetsp:Transcript_110348/g.311257  ORF Transcript_110348/g.311257 Transcript_110348/m.311257 type:complete len:108 (+) Transcript_110348:2-325(+)
MQAMQPMQPMLQPQQLLQLTLPGQEEVQFALKWGLGDEALQLLAGLPPDAKQEVLQRFDGSGTKDGNVQGRLEGFVRSVLRKRGLGAVTTVVSPAVVTQDGKRPRFG